MIHLRIVRDRRSPRRYTQACYEYGHEPMSPNVSKVTCAKCLSVALQFDLGHYQLTGERIA